jgi:hypothetical protein
MSNISLVDTEVVNEKIEKILRQTDYSSEEAFEKLKLNNFDEILTIKSYFGIKEKKNPQVKSINQEIYKQLRFKLDSNIKDYRERVEKGEVKKVI